MKRPWCCLEHRCKCLFKIPSDNSPVLTPGKSILCAGMMKEAVEFEYDKEKHKNDLSLCIYTPLKGMIRFQTNESDWETLETVMSVARRKLKENREK